jgi:hypothetical protein
MCSRESALFSEVVSDWAATTVQIGRMNKIMMARMG